MNYVIVCMHTWLYMHVHAHVYSLYICRCVYMCANVYMCAGVARTHVYICICRRAMGAYITRICSSLFYRAFYYTVDHTIGSCACVNYCCQHYELSHIIAIFTNHRYHIEWIMCIWTHDIPETPHTGKYAHIADCFFEFLWRFIVFWDLDNSREGGSTIARWP